MAVEVVLMTSGEGGTGFSSKATASISPSPNKLYLAVVASKINASLPNTPTLTGDGITWVNIGTITQVTDQQQRLTIFRGMNTSPSAGVLTFDWSGQNQERATWAIVEFSNVPITGVSGADAVVQVVTLQDNVAGPKTFTVNMSAFANGNNASFGAFQALTTTWTPGSGFTDIANVTSAETQMDVEFKNIPDTTIDDAMSGSSRPACAIGVEIAFSSGNQDDYAYLM